MNDFKCSGKIVLNYQFTDLDHYKQIDDLHNCKTAFPSNGVQIAGFIFKYLMNPMGKTMTLMKKFSDEIIRMAYLIETIEKMRSEGHCKLVDLEINEKKKENQRGHFEALFKISIEIDLNSRLP